MPKFNKELITDEKNAIHCKNENEAIALLKWAHSEGFKWRSDSTLVNNYNWYNYKEDTCYELHHNGVGYGRIKSSEKDFTILTYSDVVIK